MSSPIKFHTIYDMVAFMSRELPHALVQDWWSRLERVIRIFGSSAPRAHLGDHQQVFVAAPACDTRAHR